jgi:tRNA pseudouridine38-40 synthase
VRLRIDLGYDGTGFHGWASQPCLRTVQSTLEQALQVVLRLDRQPTVVVAGRTDTGVHARGQVVHVDVHELSASVLKPLRRQLNGVLPPDVRVQATTVAPVGFDARYSALARRYSYRLVDAPAVDPLERLSVVLHRAHLDIDRLNQASEQLLGLHDFSAFSKRTDKGTAIRTLQEFVWHRDQYGVVVARVKADAFCHSMVRSLVGALVHVGDGRQDLMWPAELLAARERKSPVAPARGLVLERVYYPAEDQLLARQTITRQIRDVSELD